MDGMEMENLKRILPIILLSIFVVTVLGGFGYAYVRIVSLTEAVDILTSEVASSTKMLAGRTDNLEEGFLGLEERTAGLSSTLSEAEENIKLTKQNIETVESRVGGFEETVGEITGTVTTLEKLSKTDPELLQKYSKVFFLNEHYVPERLSEIGLSYLYSEREPEQIHTHVLPHLNNLLDAAQSDNVTLYVKSAYRSFTEQTLLKAGYRVIFGEGTANQFSADQGYSEHQLGTTVDFITTGLNGQLYGFGNTAPYQWLLSNAYKYGFILSYPEGNQYYTFEPWHWRFVGIELATFLHNENKHFYDLEQREIDEYLVSIFD